MEPETEGKIVTLPGGSLVPAEAERVLLNWLRKSFAETAARWAEDGHGPPKALAFVFCNDEGDARVGWHLEMCAAPPTHTAGLLFHSFNRKFYNS